MKVKQFIGPFQNGPISLSHFNGARIVQIGIERPHSPLLFPIWNNEKNILESENQKIILEFQDNNNNKQSFSLGEADILEFENLYTNDIQRMQIATQDLTNPYLIINVAYE